MSGNRGPSLSRWAWFSLFLGAAIVLMADASRYLPPTGEKYVDYPALPSSDLLPSFNAAHALLAGRNPYRDERLVVRDPYALSRGGDAGVTYLYPPSHAVLYVPVVLLVGRDFGQAARVHFFASLVLLAVLAGAVVRVLGLLQPIELGLQLALAPTVAFLIGLNPGAQLGLERGQSDLITATFCWGAVLAFLRGAPATASFLAVASALLKGYGALFAAGLLWLLFRRTTARASLAGAGLALVLLLAPVAHLVPDAFAAYGVREAMFWPGWTNQGFSNLAFVLLHGHADAARFAMAATAAAIAVACWLRLRRVLRNGGSDAQRALWLTLFATASLAVPIAYSSNSIAYNCVLVLPGALVLVLGQDALLERRSQTAAACLGVSLALALFTMLSFSVHRAFGLRYGHYELPLHAVGLAVLLAVIAGKSLAGLRGPRGHVEL